MWGVTPLSFYYFMDLIGDHKLATDVVEKFADFHGLTEKECERLGITGEAGQVLRSSIADGIVAKREQKNLRDYFTEGFVNNLAWDDNRRPAILLSQNLRYITKLNLPGWPTEFPSPGPDLVEFVHGETGLGAKVWRFVPDLVSIAVYDEDWQRRDRAVIALSLIGPPVLSKLFETSVLVMNSKDYDDDGMFSSRRHWHLENLGEVYRKLGEASATFLCGKLELGDPSEQTIAARMLGSLDDDAKPVVPRMIRVFENGETDYRTKYQLLIAFQYIGDKRSLPVVALEMHRVYTWAFPPEPGETVHHFTTEEWRAFAKEKPFWAGYLQQTNKTFLALEEEEK